MSELIKNMFTQACYCQLDEIIQHLQWVLFDIDQNYLAAMYHGFVQAIDFVENNFRFCLSLSEETRNFKTLK